jgi:hypothetical protein
MFNRLNLFTASLILVSLGCGLFTPEAAPTPVPTATKQAAPTTASTPTEKTLPAEDIIPLPVMDDAEDPEDFFGLYSYATAYSVEEIVDFYKQELSALGMTVVSESVGSDYAVLSFEGEDDNVLTLNVITNDAGMREVRMAD